MKIVRARLKPFGGSSEFISVKGRIKSLIKNNTGDLFDFVVDVDGVKSVKTYGPSNINKDLVNKEIGIVDDSSFAKFNEDGTIEVTFGPDSNEGALPLQSTVNQLEKIRKKTKGTDIGDRISDMNAQGANIQYIKNPIDTGIESYEEYQKKNKSYIPNWNLKHLISPFKKNKN
jgi:hypothetical protein